MADSDLDMSDALIREREEGRELGRREARQSQRSRSRRESTQHRRRVELERSRNERQASRERTSNAAAGARLAATGERQQARAQRTQEAANRASNAAARSRSSARTTLATRAVQAPAQIGGTGVPAVTAPMVVELLIITSDELANKHRFPIPSRLLVAFLVFGGLGLFRGRAAQPAAVFGWGLVVATFYASANPKGKPAALSAVDALGRFMGGNYASKSATTASASTALGSGGPTETTAGASSSLA